MSPLGFAPSTPDLRSGLRRPETHPRRQRRAERVDGGEGGIRTHGGLLTHTHFPGVHLRPLGHLSIYRTQARSNWLHAPCRKAAKNSFSIAAHSSRITPLVTSM